VAPDEGREALGGAEDQGDAAKAGAQVFVRKSDTGVVTRVGRAALFDQQGAAPLRRRRRHGGARHDRSSAGVGFPPVRNRTRLLARGLPARLTGPRLGTARARPA
jgi:hypothetical protein